MPIFEYQCLKCSSVFDHLDAEDVECLSCESGMIKRLQGINFVPNKNFCPHDKKLDLNLDYITNKFSEIGAGLANDESKCKGCGVDGPAGFCGQKKGGCGGACRCKMKLDIFSPHPFK